MQYDNAMDWVPEENSLDLKSPDTATVFPPDKGATIRLAIFDFSSSLFGTVQISAYFLYR